MISADDICLNAVLGSPERRILSFGSECVGCVFFMVFLLSVFARLLETKGGTPRAWFVAKNEDRRLKARQVTASLARSCLPLPHGEPARVAWKRHDPRTGTANPETLPRSAGDRRGRMNLRNISAKGCLPCLAFAQKSAAERCLGRLAAVSSFVQDIVLRSSVVQTCRCGLPIGQHTRQTRPPTELRGWRNRPSSAVPVEPRCHESGSPGSTEARRRNPDRGSGFVSQNLLRSE